MTIFQFLTGVPAAALPLAALLAIGPAAKAQTPAPVYEVPPEAVAAARAYWTPERMAAAIPAPMPSASRARSREARPARPDSSSESTTPGFDPAGLPLGVVQGATLGPHTPIIPPPIGSAACDCSTDDACMPLNSTFLVPLQYYDSNQANLPYSAIGQIFFQFESGPFEGGQFTCSGASIGGNAILTAGHCVVDGDGNFATNWIFLPDETSWVSQADQSTWNLPTNQSTRGVAWTATKFIPFPGYIANDYDEARDVAFAIVQGYDSAAPDVVPNLSERLGHLGFAWNQDPTGVLWNAFGYTAFFPTTVPDPLPPNYVGPGWQMIQSNGVTACRNPSYMHVLLSPDLVTIGSQLAGGASGGPWIVDFDPTLSDVNLNYAGGINVLSNAAHVPTDQQSQVSSVYFDQAVKDLKDQAVATAP
jgi:hypothetical protein